MPDRPAPPARPKELALLAHAGPVVGLAPATTGSFLVSVGADGQLLVWKAWQPEPVRRWAVPAPVGAPRAVAMLAGNASVLVAGEQQAARVDLVSGEAMPFPGRAEGARLLAVTPSGGWAALASGREVSLFALRGQTLLRAGQFDTGPLTALELTDGAVLAGNADGQLVALARSGVELWRASLGAPLTALRAAPAGKWVAALTSDGQLHLIELGKSPRPVAALAPASPRTRPCFSASGELLFAGTGAPTLGAWRTGDAIRTVFAASHAPGATELACLAGGTLVSAGQDGAVRLWDVADQLGSAG